MSRETQDIYGYPSDQDTVSMAPKDKQPFDETHGDIYGYIVAPNSTNQNPSAQSARRIRIDLATGLTYEGIGPINIGFGVGYEPPALPRLWVVTDAMVQADKLVSDSQTNEGGES